MVPAINYSNNQAFVKSSDSGPNACFYKFGLDCTERDAMCRNKSIDENLYRYSYL